jgi:histone H1/5
MLVTLEGYNNSYSPVLLTDEYDLLGWSVGGALKKVKNAAKKAKRAAKKRAKRAMRAMKKLKNPKNLLKLAAKPYTIGAELALKTPIGRKVKKFATSPTGIKVLSYVGTAVAGACGVPIPPQVIEAGLSAGLKVAKGGSVKSAIKNVGMKYIEAETGAKIPASVKRSAKAFKKYERKLPKKVRRGYKKKLKSSRMKFATKYAKKYGVKRGNKIRKRRTRIKKKLVVSAVKNKRRALALNKRSKKLNRISPRQLKKARIKKVRRVKARRRPVSRPAAVKPAVIKKPISKMKASDIVATQKAVDKQKKKLVTKKYGSYGDAYYKKGILEGEDMVKFWEVEPYQSELNTIASDIFNNTKYPEVKFPSVETVKKMIKSYLNSVLLLSKKKGKNLYYDGTTEAERKKKVGNLFIKISYMFFKGFSTVEEMNKEKFDYVTRDQIWIVLALLRSRAKRDETYTKFWKPFLFEKTLPAEVKAEIKQEVKKGGLLKAIDPKMIMIAGVRIAALMFFTKKK